MNNLNWAIDWELDDDDDQIVSQKIVSLIRKDYENRNFPKYFRMPSVRLLSAHLQLKTNHVERAYRYLIRNKEVLYTQGTKGTYMFNTNLKSGSPSTENLLPFFKHSTYEFSRHEEKIVNVLTLGESFPGAKMTTYRMIEQYEKGKEKQVFGNPGTCILNVAYRTISRRNIVHNPDQLCLIPEGAAVNKVLKHLLAPGDRIVCASAADHYMVNLFSNLQLKILFADQDSEGMRVAQLEYLCKTETVRVVFLRPTTDFPLPGSLTDKRWARILKLADKYRFWIVLYDENYEYSKLANLNINLKKSPVVYIFPFSKLSYDFAKLGIVAAPAELITVLKKQVNKRFLGWNKTFEHVAANLYADELVHADVLKINAKREKGELMLDGVFYDHLKEMGTLVFPDAGLFAAISFHKPIDPAIVERLREMSIYHEEENGFFNYEQPIDVLRISLCIDDWNPVRDTFKMIKACK